MKGFIFCLLVFLTYAATIYAEDIKLKDGTILKNVTIVSSNESFYSIILEDGSKSKIRKDLIDNIIKPVDDSESPCNDKLLLRLAAKDSLSVDEMRMYVELKKMCADYKQAQRKLDQSEEITQSVSGAVNTYKTILYVSLGLSIVGLLVLVL